MVTYAVLGATGNCGTALLSLLLQRPSAKIHAYCRNKAKLLHLLPELADSKQVEIFEGGIQDTQLLASCIRSTRAIFLCISTNDNIPGCRLSQDSASAVLQVLQTLQQSPKLVLLSSATLDDHFSRHVPYLLRQILLRSASHVYADLRATEALLRAQDAWLSCIFIKPGALSTDVQRGHALSLTDENSPLSYLDLAAGMLEAADDEAGMYAGRDVSVVNTGGRAKFPRGTPLCILMGLMRHFFPGLHEWLPSTGPG
jgi:putative NADH-flavin reductase